MAFIHVQKLVYTHVVHSDILKSKHDVDFKEDIECFARRIKLTTLTHTHKFNGQYTHKHSYTMYLCLCLLRVFVFCVQSFELQQCVF